MAKFAIKKGARTAGHKATIEAVNAKLPEELRYKVTETAETIEIEAKGGVVADVLSEGETNEDLQKAVLQQVVKIGGMMTYGGTSVTTPSGKRYHSLPLCGKLGILSAFVSKEVGGASKAGKANLNDVLAGL